MGRTPSLPCLWMLLSSFAFAVMAALGHALGAGCGWLLVALARCAVPLAAVIGLALAGRCKLALCGPAALWVWSVGVGVGMLSTFYALSRLPASDVLTITNTYPLWVALLSWPLLGQRPGRRLWPCLAAAVAGVALVQRPNFARADPALFAALTASLTSAFALLALHRLKGHDKAALVGHSAAVALVLAAGCLLLVGGPCIPADGVSGGTLTMLLGVGATAGLGQLFLTRAMTAGRPARVAVIGLSQVVFAMGLDLLVAGRSFDALTLAGTALIIAPTAWVMVGEGAEREASRDEGAETPGQEGELASRDHQSPEEERRLAPTGGGR